MTYETALNRYANRQADVYARTDLTADYPDERRLNETRADERLNKTECFPTSLSTGRAKGR